MENSSNAAKKQCYNFAADQERPNEILNEDIVIVISVEKEPFEQAITEPTVEVNRLAQPNIADAQEKPRKNDDKRSVLRTGRCASEH